MTKHRAPRWRRERDERGATFILVAISMVLLLWGGAFGVDLGLTVDGGRQVQAIADTSAMDMARFVNIADYQTSSPTASATFLNGKLPYALTDNGSNANLSEVAGLWLGGTFYPGGQGLGCYFYKPPQPHPCNAVKVTATQSVPQIFVGGQASVSRTAIGAVTPEAGFSIGSFLASFNSQQSTVLNAILGELGTPVSLTAVGYAGLANTYVTVNQLITASGGLLTPSNVMTASLTGAQWLAIWSDAVANQVAQLNCGSSPTPEPCNASAALSTLDFSSSNAASLCQLVSINGSICSSGNLSTSALSTSLDTLQMLSTEAELANGTNALDLGTSLGITGVTDAKLKLTLTQIPQVAYGPVGTTATTAQLSSDLQLSVLGVGLLDVPLSAAQGTATLQTLSCAKNAMTATAILPTTTTTSGAVTLAGSNVATLTISGYNGSAVGYTPAVVPPTASTAAADSNPITVSSNTIAPYYPTLSYSSPTGLFSGSVSTLLTMTLPGVLPQILQAAGVTVGGAEVADLSTNCGAVSLVQ
jgi:uncharacterized membrane protein